MPTKTLHKQFSKTFPGLVPWVIWTFAIFFYMYQVILRISASVFADDWISGYGISSEHLGMLSGAFYYAYAGMQITSGRIMDKWGVRNTLTVASLTCALGSYIMATSSTYYAGMLGRFIIGIGSSCGYLGCLKIATVWFTPRQTSLIAGLSFSFGMIGGVIGNTPLALLNQHMHWQDIQMFFVWIGVGISALAWLGIRPPNKHDLITKYREAQAAIQELGKTKNKKKKKSLSKGKLLRIVSNPQAWIIATFGMLMYVPFAAFTDLWGISYFRIALGISETEASAINSLTFLGTVCAGPAYALLARHLRSHKHTMRISAICYAVCFGILLFAPYLPHSFVGFMSFALGFCFGGEILSYVAVVSLFPRNMSGTASGFTNTVVNLSGIIFQPLTGFILVWISLGPTPTKEEFQLALIPIFLCVIISVVFTFFMKETFPPKKKSVKLHETTLRSSNQKI